MSDRHLVEVASVETTFASRESASRAQDRLNEFFAGQLMRLVDEVFTECCPDDRVYHIEHLEIDVGLIGPDQSDDDLANRIRDALRRTLHEALSGTASSGSSFQAQPMPRAVMAVQQFEYFLLHGRLPWNADLTNSRAPETLVQHVVAHAPDRLIHFLKQTRSRPAVLRRLARQCSARSVMSIVRLLASSSLGSDEPFMQVFLEQLADHGLHMPDLETQPLVWETVMQVLVEKGAMDNEPAELARDCGRLAILAWQRTNAADPEVHMDSATVSRSSESEPAVCSTDATDVEADELIRRFAEILDRGSNQNLFALWAQLRRCGARCLTMTVRRYGRRAHVRHRMADFPEPLLRDIVHWLQPTGWDEIERIRTELSARLRPDPSRREHPAGFEHHFWYATLTYLLVEDVERFDRSAYLASLLRQWNVQGVIDHRLVSEAVNALMARWGIAFDDRTSNDFRLVQHGEAQQKEREGTAMDPVPYATLIEGYDQYAYLRQRIFSESTSNVHRGPERIGAVIGRITEDVPWLLLRIFRELQLDPERIHTMLSRRSLADVAQLVRSVVSLTTAGKENGPSALLTAIEMHAQRARDPRQVFTSVLHCLASNALIDFDALCAASSDDSARGPIDDSERYGAESCRFQPEQEKYLAKPESPAGTVSDSEMSSASGANLENLTRRPKIPVSEKSTPGVHGSDEVGQPDRIPSEWDRFLQSTSPISAQDIRAFRSTFLEWFAAKPRSVRSWLETTLIDRKRIQRFVELLSEPWLVRVLGVLRPQVCSSVLQCADFLTDASMAARLFSEPRDATRFKWTIIFQYLLEEERPFTESLFAAQFVEQLRHILGSTDHRALCAAMAQQLSLNLLPSTRPMQRRLMALLDRISERSALTMGLEQDRSQTAGHLAHDLSDEVPLDRLYVRNAGLVLAGPYLPRLLTVLGLVRDSAFRDEEAAQRGVHVLQYLVTEQVETLEFQLVLNKILCGIPLDMPVIRSIELTDHEKTTITQLLQAMIQHWSKLGQTSVSGFRESFLRRDGRLEYRDATWQLSVELRAYDVLLDYLPWSYTILKYPWMARPVYVNWRA